MSAYELRQNEERRIAQEITNAIVSGVPGGEERLYDRYKPGLLWLLRRKGASVDASMDVAHEVFLVALTKLRADGLEHPERLVGFLHQTAKNLWASHVRQQKRHNTDARSDLLEEMVDAGADPVDAVAGQERSRIVRVLLGEMSQLRDVEILTAVFLEELDYTEVADRYGVSREHVSRILYRAKKRFREIIEAAESKQSLRLIS